MKAKIYSHNILIGYSDLQLADEAMGVVSGFFRPTESYKTIQKTIWGFHNLNSKVGHQELNALRLNAQLENGLFLFPAGGFLITNLEALPDEDLEFEAAGLHREVVEDNFLSKSPAEKFEKSWESISIEQKLAFEDELIKEIGMDRNRHMFSFLKKKHRLVDYEFSAQAVAAGSDDVLFALRKMGENLYSYAVIHLTWKGKTEKNDLFPRTEFFENFEQFVRSRMNSIGPDGEG